eukprot:15205389-Alexandrium_andersonii.AAC.1
MDIVSWIGSCMLAIAALRAIGWRVLWHWIGRWELAEVVQLATITDSVLAGEFFGCDTSQVRLFLAIGGVWRGLRARRA